MPIDFPLDQLFDETFRGHPLGDMAWLHYVSGGDRKRVNHYLSDSRVHSVVGSSIFEKTTYTSIPQLITAWDDVVRKFLFLTCTELQTLIVKLLGYCDWLQDLDNGPLKSASSAERKMFEHFTTPDSRAEGQWIDSLYKEISRQFPTKFEAQ